MYPNIFHSLSGKSAPLLSWTHYRTLIQVKDDKARNWYEKEALLIILDSSCVSVNEVSVDKDKNSAITGFLINSNLSYLLLPKYNGF